MRSLLYSIVLLSLLTASGCNRGGSPVEAAAPQATTPPIEEGLHLLPAASPQLTRIRVDTVHNVPLPSEEVLAPGKIEANPNRISRIVMPVSGRVRKVLVRLGDSVAQGQPLLIVDSPDAGAAMTAYRQAQAQTRQAQSSLNMAQKDLSRLRELYEHHAAALKDVLSAENDVAQAQAALDQSQAASDDSIHRLELLGLKPGAQTDVIVRAPIPGKVLDIGVVPGEYRNDTTAPLLTIADLSTVWISADVPEGLIRRVERGETIEVELSAYPGQIYRGRVTRIADMVDPQSRAIKVQAEIANPGGRLRPEMYGQIRHNHGLVPRPAVPAAAILQKSGHSIALVEEAPGRFRERAIEIDGRKADMIAVTSGLREGDRIVVDGAMLLLKKD